MRDDAQTESLPGSSFCRFLRLSFDCAGENAMPCYEGVRKGVERGLPSAGSTQRHLFCCARRIVTDDGNSSEGGGGVSVELCRKTGHASRKIAASASACRNGGMLATNAAVPHGGAAHPFARALRFACCRYPISRESAIDRSGELQILRRRGHGQGLLWCTRTMHVTGTDRNGDRISSESSSSERALDVEGMWTAALELSRFPLVRVRFSPRRSSGPRRRG